MVGVTRSVTQYMTLGRSPAHPSLLFVCKIGARTRWVFNEMTFV